MLTPQRTAPAPALEIPRTMSAGGPNLESPRSPGTGGGGGTDNAPSPKPARRVQSLNGKKVVVDWRDDESHTILDVARHTKINSAALALKWDVLIREYLIHLFLPWSVVYVWWAEGMYSMRNRHFWGYHPRGTAEWIIQFLQYGVQCSFWVMMALTFAYPQKVYDSGVIVDVVAVIILTNYRNLLIGLKYSYLSKRVLHEHVTKLRATRDMRADELLFGWLPLKIDVARRKVDAACGRRGLDSNMTLILEMDDEREDPIAEAKTTFAHAIA